jgi:glutamate dehydrogenase/leucine dehydrogenase
MAELTLPPSVERRNKLDTSLGYCNEIDPRNLLSLGPAVEIRVDGPEQLVDFLLHDAEDDRLYFVNHLPAGDREWEYVCFAKHGTWTFFSSIFSTALAYNPQFLDGKRRRLVCGGTRIIAKQSLEGAAHRQLASMEDELVEALRMNLFLSEAMTGKNLSNGFNVGGSKNLVYLGELQDRWHVAPDQVREFCRFMAMATDSITQSLPVFIGTGSDLNFHEHGGTYYDLCSRISPNYTGADVSARRWGRQTSGNTTAPTAAGVLACLDAVRDYLDVPPEQRGLLVKGLGGIGLMVAQHYANLGWKVYASEIHERRIERAKEEVGDALTIVSEEEWEGLSGVSLFSPNAAAHSLQRANLPVLKKMGVRAVIGGENNIRERGLDADVIYRDYGILTFADFLLNGGGAWIVGAEMVERPVGDVHDWIAKYQVPTVLQTIELAKEENRSPESLFEEFIQRKVQELLT